MPAPTYTVPTNNSDTATEEPKVTIALSDLKALLTGNLDDDNVATGGIGYAKLDLTGDIKNADVKSNAAIAYSKLASLATNQLLVGNAGVPTARSIGGAIAAVSTNGVFSLQYQFAAATGTVGLSINGSTWTTITSLTTAETGTYLIQAKFRGANTVPGEWSCLGRITQGLSPIDQAENEGGSLGGASPSLFVVVDATAGDTIALQGVTQAASGTSSSTYARLFMQRLE